MYLHEIVIFVSNYDSQQLGDILNEDMRKNNSCTKKITLLMYRYSDHYCTIGIDSR